MTSNKRRQTRIVSCEVKFKTALKGVFSLFRDPKMFLRVDGGADRTEKEKDADAHEEKALIMYLH